MSAPTPLTGANDHSLLNILGRKRSIEGEDKNINLQLEDLVKKSCCKKKCLLSICTENNYTYAISLLKACQQEYGLKNKAEKMRFIVDKMSHFQFKNCDGRVFYIYEVKFEGKTIPLCRESFCTCYGVSDRQMRKVQELLKTQTEDLPDLNDKTKHEDAIIKEVNQFLNSLIKEKNCSSVEARELLTSLRMTNTEESLKVYYILL